MSRKSQNAGLDKPLELLVPREKAERKLRERIATGSDIKSLSISSAQDLKEARNEFYKWDDYNDALLKQIFTKTDLAEEYSFSGSIFVVGDYEKSLQEKIADFHDDIDSKTHRLESIAGKIELFPTADGTKEISQKAKFDRSKVFIVHGHDDTAKLEVARFIEKIGFIPVILHEQPSRSNTIIEKIEKNSDVGFAVVIYTPCDIGGKNADPPSLRGRARQNVVFEHGFLIGKLGRENVCSLYKGDVETLSDLSGIVYVPMAGNWQIDLAKELRAASYTVDMNQVI